MKNLILLAIAGVFCAQAQAQLVPAKSPKCARKIHLRAPRYGAGVFFNETCDTAFVLPPAEASVDVRAVAPSMNASMCPIVNARIEYAKVLQRRIEDVLASLKPGDCDPDDPFRVCRKPSDPATIESTIREVMKL